MNEFANPLTVLFAFLIGTAAGSVFIYLSRQLVYSRKLRVAQRKAAHTVAEAQTEAKSIVQSAREEAEKMRMANENELRERRTELAKQENRVTQKVETLERKLENLDTRERDLLKKEKSIDEEMEKVEALRGQEQLKLEEVAGLTTQQAKDQLIEMVESEMQVETARRIRQWEQRIKEEADEKARNIIIHAIQRTASDIVAETTVSVVPIPSDEMKGRLIGREGRNIRALEQATGVDLIIDDTPEAVTISSFDPVRREIARLVLSKLVLDGRIHPARIEEVVTKAKEEVDAAIQSAGEQAAYAAGVHGLRPELVKIMGRLKYRTSYGQNVLQHSVEVAQLAGMMAADLGINVNVARRAGFLHDIGKAVDREVEGTHAAIGADLVKQWDKNPDVVKGVAEHHFDQTETSIWGFLVSAADAISSARPGARRESLENYIKRLKALEEIANSFKGVDRSYAIQAGREVRILVKPEEVDDLGSMRLARDIVKKIEEGLEYPGQIKVTVLRETRATDYAR
ncbi:ribonuclease Y [Dehalogenimonas alkenigignens]|uniref:Ribonuclease Y n=1 Tax=Dehalogenimonas alkenigignens TaxID=1217799 RepID=A0A0W0GGI9_9CHLR|nr:ribonuclease Y [Dehalogenimonas alkenigignens]KTB47669.1 ribonuclease Y [Dehalogenimonas alkenigignens]PVV84061.1 ribonuclease Y [Dehalogenimonas alkenigignens]